MSSNHKPTTTPGIDESAALIGSTIAGRYKVDGLLGEGAMGAVYLVQHTGIRKRMALKLLRPELMRNPAMLTRFEREAMAAAHLDHPNVASATDFGRTDQGRFFLVLEYVHGQELRTVMEGAGPLPLARALFIARQIASALLRAHELGIVHRDLKPENIMLVERDGHSDFVKVLDFGLAHVPIQITDEPEDKRPTKNVPKITNVGDVFGTPAYMSPEQSVGESTDGRTDLYALGVLLYEMIAGVRPFTGKSLLVLMQQHLSTPPPPIAERAPAIQVPAEVELLLQRLLAKPLDERIQHPQEVLNAIDEIVATYKLDWPARTTPEAESPLAVQTKAGKRESSLSKAWNSLRTRPLSMRTISTVEQTLILLRETQPISATNRWVPTTLMRPLQRVPRWWFLLAAGLLLALLTRLTLHLFKAEKPSQQTPLAIAPTSRLRIDVPQCSQVELDQAITQGPSALSSLAGRFPSDTRILRALVRGLTGQQKHAEAMRVMSQLAAIDASACNDAELAQSIVSALQSDGEAAQAAVVLLERDLGALGVDLLYDLTVKQTGARWKPRLQQSLTKPEVVAKASTATRLAIDLRAAKQCEAKRDLLPRVQTEGDRRALVQLRGLLQTQGCGFLGVQDCWPCLRKSSALQDTITTMERRIGPSAEK